MRRIVVCAATGTEAGAAKGANVVTTGVGPRHADKALDHYLRHSSKPDLVVSFGFAGGPNLPLGTWVTATEIAGMKLVAAPAPARVGTIVSTEDLGADYPDADAVDMESEALARVAAKHDVPLMILRLTSDSREKPLPGFLQPFTAAMTAESKRAKLGNALRGLTGAIKDPRGVARLVRDGSALAKDLAAGWREFEPKLQS